MSLSDFIIYNPKLPNGQTALKRINVFLGANGTGKSKLLKHLVNVISVPNTPGLPPQYSSENEYLDNVVYIEGGRALNIQGNLSNQGGFHGDSLQFYVAQHQSVIKGSLAARITWSLKLLEKHSQLIRLDYSDKISILIDNGQTQNLPNRATPPLQKLFEIFNDIFPSISLNFSEETKSITCSKGGEVYEINELSDGEKQTLAILADIRLLAPDNGLVIVDEPEINLNPGLAVKLWDTIENDLPLCRFIYSTHCISFAIRENVEKVVVLSENPLRSKEIENVSEIDRKDLSSLLGSIPAILSKANALIVEGGANSFDTIFYKWLINNKDIEILPIGSCEDVIAVSERQGVWQNIAIGVTIYGLIDRDFKSDDQIGSFGGKYGVLDYHEAESYLCDPKVIATIASGIASQYPLPTENDVVEVIIKEFERQFLEIAAKRVFAKSNKKDEPKFKDTWESQNRTI